MFGTFTEKDRIMQTKIDLNNKNPFFAYILMNMQIEQTQADERIPTMGVNAYGDLYWNEDFVKTLTTEALQGVLAHEAMHMATLTHERKGTKDHMLWNIATDLIINAMLKEDGFSLPKNCIYPDDRGNWEFTGKDEKKIVITDVVNKIADEIYDILEANAEQVYVSMAADGNGKGSSSDGDYKGSFDKHLEGSSNDKGEEQKNADGTSKTEADAKANAEKWKKITTEAVTAAKQKGKGGSRYERMLEGLLNPELDWRTLLHQFMTKDLPVDYTMRLPGRRYHTTGVYYPSVIRENLDICVAIDVSGSISTEEYTKFMSEVVGITKAFDQINLRCLWWSTEVTDDIQVLKYDSDRLITHKFSSTGGTHMSCVADYLKKNRSTSRIFVFLTDGYIEQTPKLPDGKVMFVLAGNSSDEIVKNYGITCKLKKS